MRRQQEVSLIIEREQIHFIKSKLRHKRDFYYYLNFGLYAIPAFFIVAGLVIFYFGRVKPATGQHIGNFLPMVIITAGVAIALFLSARIKEAESFLVIPVQNFELETVTQAIKTKFQIEAISYDEEQHILSVQTRPNRLSNKEYLLIIKDGQSLLINSRSARPKQPVMLFRNKKNIEQLKEIIEKTCC